MFVASATLILALAATVSLAAASPEFVEPDVSTFVNHRFSATGTRVTIEAANGFKVTCKTVQGSGILSATEASISDHGYHCVGPAGSCGSASAASGEVWLSANGPLVYVKRPKKVAIDALIARGGYDEFECERPGLANERILVTGGILVVIAPVNKLTSSFKIKLKQQHGQQQPDSFEGGVREQQVMEAWTTFPEPETELFAAESGINYADTLTVMRPGREPEAASIELRG